MIMFLIQVDHNSVFYLRMSDVFKPIPGQQPLKSLFPMPLDALYIHLGYTVQNVHSTIVPQFKYFHYQ